MATKTNNTKRKQQKRRYARRSKGIQLDVLLSLLLLLIAAAFFYMAFTFKIIPIRWVIILCLLVFVIVAILIVLIFKRMSMAATVLRRCITLLLIAGLSVGSIYISHAKQALEDISDTATVQNMVSIITPSDSKIDNISDLKGKKVGVQSGIDKDNANFVKGELKSTVKGVKFVESIDYTSMANDMIAGDLDAMIISDSQITTLNDTVSNFSIKKVKSYVREKQNTLKGSGKDITEEVFTVYVSGLDEVGDPHQDLGSDANLLLIVEPIANKIQMISIPRDAFVPNPAADNENDKLTHTGRYGIDATVGSIEEFLGIKIDYYAKISFSSIIDIVDILDGIEVDVAVDFCEQDENRSIEEGDLICLNKGKQKLNGKQALAYSRHRHSYIDQDLGRNKAQQQVIKAIIKRVVSTKGVSVADQLLDALPDVVVTNIPSSQITAFASKELDDMKTWDLTSLTLGNGITDRRITASIPGIPVDVYLFDRDEVSEILELYDGAMNRLKMNEFQFDLQKLHTIEAPGDSDGNLVWSHQAINPPYE